MSSVPAEFVLGARQLYMLPTRHGVLFAITVLVMLLAAVNYNNGLAYALTFLLAAAAIVSMLYTHRNVAGLELTVGAPRPVFAGEALRFPVTVCNRARRTRPGVWLLSDPSRRQLDLRPGETLRVELSVPAGRRGWVPCPEVRVASSFPLGLLYTWSTGLEPSTQGLAYPAPGRRLPLPVSPDRRRHQEAGPQPDGDDFIGLRDYRPEDPPRHVHWKAAARGFGLLTKQFGGAAAGRVWIDWDNTFGHDMEARLSQLCRLILDADHAGTRYGLRLPGTLIEPQHGPAHRHDCLRALATWSP